MHGMTLHMFARSMIMPPFSVGPIRNLQCVLTPNGLVSTWNESVEGKCPGSPMNYTVTIAQESNVSIVHQFEVNDNRIEILNASYTIEPGQNYFLSVARGGFCDEVSIQCETGSGLLLGEWADLLLA